MYSDQPQYEVYGYVGDGISYWFSHAVDARRDEEVIEHVREFQRPDFEELTDNLSYADIFYCDEHGVTMIGTWVTDRGEAIWHAGGWAERPRPSKEAALRFLYSRGRPA